jgi:hypothetical protein
VRHWALVTDAHAGGHRLVTFTHSETVKDVSAELPDSEAPVYFLTFAKRSGPGEVLIVATGDRQAGAPPVFGQIVIDPK